MEESLQMVMDNIRHTALPGALLSAKVARLVQTVRTMSFHEKAHRRHGQRGGRHLPWLPLIASTRTVGRPGPDHVHAGVLERGRCNLMDGLEPRVQRRRPRMSRGDGTTTVDYVWDVVGGLPLLLQDGTNTYVYGLGLIAIYDGSEMTYRLVDGLGSTVNLCDQDGELVGEYTYDAYGNVREQSGDGTEFSFAGEQSDPNGLDFLRARYYDPEIGRFLSGDPLGGGYGYAAGNPINLTDPSGLVPAGTCLTMNNASHLLVPCGGADAEALVGDRWYNDYLTGMQAWTESTRRGDAALTALLAEAFAPPDPTDVVAEKSFAQAAAAPPLPPASTLQEGKCDVTAYRTNYGGGALVFGGGISCSFPVPGFFAVWVYLEDLQLSGMFNELTRDPKFPKLCLGLTSRCHTNKLETGLEHVYYQLYVLVYCSVCRPQYGSAIDFFFLD
jgi:RHS repeat-associated protein